MKHLFLIVFLAFFKYGSLSSQEICEEFPNNHHFNVVLGRMSEIIPFIRENPERICRGRCQCKDFTKFHVYYVSDESNYNQTDNLFWLRNHVKKHDNIVLISPSNRYDKSLWSGCNCILEIEVNLLNEMDKHFCVLKIKTTR